MKTESLLRYDKETDTLRKSGIEVVGDIPWGTHLCQFYETKEDLIDILVPYFAEGLRNNEFCMWVTSEPLGVEKARAALQKAVPDLEQYIKKGQIEILPHTDWYLLGGEFDADRVLEGWVEKEKGALDRGFAGLRLTGNTFWIERNDWKSFVDYEATVNDVIGEHRMIAICSYSLEKCTGSDVVDVMKNHESVLFKKGKTWILAEDVYMRRLLEKKVAEGQTRLKNIFAASPDNITVTDLNGNITDCNQATLDMGGFSSKDEVIGKNALEFIAKKDHKRAMEDLKKILEQDSIKNIQYTGLAKDGDEFPSEFSVSVIKDSSGNPTGFVAITKDITERKKAQEEIEAGRKKLKTYIESMVDGLCVNDINGTITQVNEAFAGMLGYKSPKGLIGKTIFENIEQKEIPRATKRFMERVKEGESRIRNFEIICLRKDGSKFPASFNIRNLWEKGKYVGSISVARDITERKRMEDKVKRYSEHLEELVEERTRALKEAHERLLKSERLAAIGEVATMVGHDLRNPLQAITNAAYTLKNMHATIDSAFKCHKKAFDLFPEALADQFRQGIPLVHEAIRLINESVNYADGIVSNLHDFAVTKKPTLKKTSINALVEETLSQVKAPESVQLVTDLGRLPEIEVDKDVIKRCFVNLAINGIQAMEKGGRLKISTKKTKGFVEVSFKDTGAGISKENMKKIFIPFFTTKAKGMGMGLAICKKFGEIHGGSIEVETEEGKGSTFTVKLPIE